MQHCCLVAGVQDGADQAEELAKEDEADGVLLVLVRFSSAQSAPPRRSHRGGPGSPFSLRLELTIVTEYRANRRRETGSGPLAAELMSGFLSFAASFLWLNATLFLWLSLRLFWLRSRLDRCWFRRTPCFLRLRRPLRFSWLWRTPGLLCFGWTRGFNSLACGRPILFFGPHMRPRLRFFCARRLRLPARLRIMVWRRLRCRRLPLAPA